MIERESDRDAHGYAYRDTGTHVVHGGAERDSDRQAGPDAEPNPTALGRLAVGSVLLSALIRFPCEDHAYRNTLTRLSFEQRLGRLGHTIKAGVEMPRDTTTEECETRLAVIKDHRLAKLGRNTDQVSRAEMAVRLVRWLRHTPGATPSFTEQANNYIRELLPADGRGALSCAAWADTTTRHRCGQSDWASSSTVRQDDTR